MHSIKRKIFGNIAFLVCSALIFSNVLIAGIMYFQIFQDRKEQVKNEAYYIKKSIEIVGNHWIAKDLHIDSKSRLTLISRDGTVIFDSMEDISKLENHRNRPEIVEALKKNGNGTGESVRISETLGEQTFYYAVLLKSGNVVRVAYTTDSIFVTIAGLLKYMIAIMCIVLLLTLILAKRQTLKILGPINQINLEIPLENDIYEEMTPLLYKIDKQNQKINEQLNKMKEKQAESNMIIENMKEGLILLDEKSKVLAVNPSALNLFGAEKENCINQHVINLSRNFEFQTAIDTVQKKKSVSQVLQLKDGYYNILAHPILEEDKLRGIVILILDITEHHKLEEMRKEFSANVSHELKTPLMTISGYAEIMKNGFVKEKDITEFSSRIYNEALRLKNLVDDIIKISRLDEKNNVFDYEEVNLLSLSRIVAERLKTQAEKNNIKISVFGEDISIIGVKQILDEMIHNLCENAVKYNKNGGKVEIRLTSTKEHKILSVIDTGIGISRKHQSRIFERFYRVDKSHSRESGGTGLGLSIVKHAATFHNAVIKLESIKDKGTTISIIF
ncbi:ATP-binding protein [Anaerosacchariphilus polymeriproducens]|uniref:histidine kinase n=1 Tax=Anaerosacchariphilus polymeriproducens TaxID=1812858 RepID=A0A371AWG1_9FIRM|nr:ATP-binding protein [Anaerosacchariphilus polymeriproducens]RDU23881.1 PAS domain S-box protein [Anaerosacchariphilus polymeriproducens]